MGQIPLRQMDRGDQQKADDLTCSLPDDEAIATGFEAIGVECTQRRITLTYQIAVSLVVEPISGEVDDFEISPTASVGGQGESTQDQFLARLTYREQEAGR
jgi:hypothetical protein